MKFLHLLILIGSTLALGIIGIFSARFLLGLMPKVWVVLILAAVGFFLVVAVVRINSRQIAVTAKGKPVTAY